MTFFTVCPVHVVTEILTLFGSAYDQFGSKTQSLMHVLSIIILVNLKIST